MRNFDFYPRRTDLYLYTYLKLRWIVRLSVCIKRIIEGGAKRWEIKIFVLSMFLLRTLHNSFDFDNFFKMFLFVYYLNSEISEGREISEDGGGMLYPDW